MGEIHFLNVGCADCTVIKSARKTFLVDCARRVEIYKYRGLFPADHRLSAVFITHQHPDHFKGLEFLKGEGYFIENLIYSPYVRRRNDPSVNLEDWQDFEQYRDYFKNNGTQVFPPISKRILKCRG
jgi:phosphoribosyl 1,2-cyclic phosphodiesterase